MKKGEVVQEYFDFNIVSLEDYKTARFEGMRVNYQYYDTHLGKVLVVTDPIGVLYVGFVDEIGKETAFSDCPVITATAEYHQAEDELQHQVIDFISGKKPSKKIIIHVDPTEFQLQVWKELLNIPLGAVKSYKDIALALNKPRAARAVGTAIGNNPIAFLIPCHRVVRSDGQFGGYRWGMNIKKKIIDWEKQL